jgi:CBS domain-containing protein
MVPVLKAKGLWRETYVGLLRITVLRARDVKDTVVEMADKGSYCHRSNGTGFILDKRDTAKRSRTIIVPPGGFPHLHADHSLDVALDRMGPLHLDLLPVVSRANVHELLGVVELGDVLEAYGLGKKKES